MKAEDKFETDKVCSKMEKRVNFIIFITLLIFGIMLIIPFVWMGIVSFERYANVSPPFPPSLKVKDPSLFNFKVIIENGGILRVYKNSLIIAVGSVLVNLFSVLLGGYALSKGKFKGKKIVIGLILGTMMIPFETRMIPMFKMFAKLNLTNNYLPLILPNMIDGFGILLMKQFFDKLPDSLSEAAEIDGAKRITIFTKVFLPLTGPICATIVILKFMDSWNSFLWPLVILTGEKLQTVPIFISTFSIEGGTRLAGSTMCVAFLGVIPVIILFLLLQKYIIQSIALTGVKG